MKYIRYSFFLFIVVLLSIIFVEVTESAQIYGKGCLDCHPALQEKISEEKAHSPVKEGNCISCHNPHTSNHKGLLKNTEETLCYSCHKNDRSGGFSQAVIHAPVKDGKCLNCHNPHSSTNDMLLTQKSGEVCFSCHPKDTLITGKESHPLVKKGECVTCHAPHSSSNEGLMKKRSADLCSSCHKAREKQFINAHSGYPVEESNCSSCHNPHSSDNKSLLKASMHQPMAKRDCTACHNNNDSKSPLMLKNKGVNLCYNCHENIKKDFEKINSHLIGNKNNSCLNCHNPHASDTKFLLDKREEKVCFKCHWDTERRVTAKTSLFKHPKLEDCSSCHMAHGSDNITFLKAKEGESCNIGKCHEQQQIFSHPVGSDIIDPRNKKAMSCITCHNPMGSGFKYNLRLNPDSELCEQCHRF